MANNASERRAPMQVLALSPPRTGTKSMYQALSILLEAPVYHGIILTTTHKTATTNFWLKCIEAKYEGKGTPYTRADFDTCLCSFVGVTDMPCCFLWSELMDAYPEAKVVLVNRDFDSWYKSFVDVAIHHGAFAWITYLIVFLEPLMGTSLGTMAQKQLLGYFGAKNAAGIKRNARGVFERHYEGIREKCGRTPGRLLEMRIEEGWEPLCGFLGKEVPGEAFPRVNDKAEVSADIGEFLWDRLGRGVLAMLKYAVPVMAIAGGLWYYSHAAR